MYTVTVLPCPQQTGACCVPQLDGNVVSYICLTNLTQDQCTSQGGLYQGNGSGCTGNTCKFCAPPPLNMVAWWPADGTTTDLTSNGNNGILQNGATYTPGMVGQAFLLDGVNDYVRVLDNSILDFGPSTSVPGSGDLSIDAWIRTGAGQGVQSIVDKRSGAVGSSTNPVRGYAFFLFNGNLSFQLSDGIGSATSNFISSTPVADGDWHHVAASIDRDSPTGGHLYVDGVQVFTFNPTGRPGSLSNSADLWIGARQPISTPIYFPGKIDEVEIFSRAITPEEVFAIFNAGAKGKCKEGCHLPRAVPCCSLGGPGAAAVTICNYTNTSQTYSVVLSSLPAGGGCTIPGPSGFIPSTLTATVPAGTCQAFPFTISCPTGVPVSGGIGCFQAGITNVNTGLISQCIGTIRPTLKWCISTPVDCCTGVLGVGGTASLGFQVTNTNDPGGTLPFQIRAYQEGSSEPTNLVRLNGLPPGTRYIGNLSLAPGESAVVPVDVTSVGYEPFTVLDIVLEADLDGDGVYEALFSHSLRLLPPTLVDLVTANPPAVSPYNPPQRFRDVLQNQSGAGAAQGIGFPGTPDEAGVRFVPIFVVFSGSLFPAPTTDNVTVDCTDSANNGTGDCPTVTSVVGGGSTWFLTLSAPPPPRECITFQFAGAVPGQWLQYQVLPGDTNLDASTNTIDLLWLVQRLNDGTANTPANRARYNVDRSTGAGPQVNTVDLLRLVQLLNGTNTTQAFNGASVVPCP